MEVRCCWVKENRGQGWYSLPASWRTAAGAWGIPNPESLLGPCWGDSAKAEPSSWGSRTGAQRCQAGTGVPTLCLRQDLGQGTKCEHHFWVSAQAAPSSASQKPSPAAWSQFTATPHQSCWVPATTALGRSGGEAAGWCIGTTKMRSCKSLLGFPDQPPTYRRQVKHISDLWRN